jgi:S-adenosylmethionine hydrolase
MVKPPLLLVTDFGSKGPYLGQMRIVLSELAPDHQVIDLISDAPLMQPKAAAYLLSALADVIPSKSILVVVVDPGVGGPRSAVVLQTDHHWYVGPDNGLLAVVAQRASNPRIWRIDDKPKTRSKTFH